MVTWGVDNRGKCPVKRASRHASVVCVRLSKTTQHERSMFLQSQEGLQIVAPTCHLAISSPVVLVFIGSAADLMRYVSGRTRRHGIAEIRLVLVVGSNLE